MRKLALVVGVLALAGCGQGNNHPGSSKPATPAQIAAAAPQWDLQVQGQTPQAVSDVAAWLIEHGFSTYIANDGGKTRILVGPFATKAEAEAKQALLVEKLATAKKRSIESFVVEHVPAS